MRFSKFHEKSAIAIYRREVGLNLFQFHELIDCTPTPLIGAIIVNDYHAPPYDFVEKIFEAQLGESVPAAIQTQNSD